MNRRYSLVAVGFAAFAIAVSLLVYSGSLSGPYLFDDLPAFNGNLDQVPFPPLMNWLHPETRPLLQVWFTILRRFSESPVAVYRVAGVLIHVVNCGLIFVLVRCIGRKVNRDGLAFAYLEKVSDSYSKKGRSGYPGLTPFPQTTYLVDRIAGMVAFIWLIHPVCVQAVCSIIQQAELLMSTFFICYLLVIATNTNRSRWHSAISLWLFLIAGLYTKVVMVGAIPVGILLDALLNDETVTKVLKKHWQFHAVPVAFGFILASTMLPMLLRSDAGIGFGGDAPPADVYLMSSCRSFVIYLGLTFWPASLAIDRGPHFITDWSQAAPYAMGLTIYLGLACYAWRSGFGKNTTRRLLGWLMLSPLFILAPTSSFVPTADPLFEHRFYLPLAFIIGAVVLVTYEMSFMRFGHLRYFYKVSLAMVTLIVVMLAIRSSIRARDYSSSINAWRSALMVDGDNARAAQNFVAAIQEAGTEADLVGELTALIVHVDKRGQRIDALAHQLAKLHLRRGEPDAAITILTEVTRRSAAVDSLLTDRQRREVGERWFDLAVVYAQLGRPDRGIEAIKQTILATPDDMIAHAMAADLYDAIGDEDLAMKHRQIIQRLSASRTM